MFALVLVLSVILSVVITFFFLFCSDQDGCTGDTRLLYSTVGQKEDAGVLL